ncbi:MAG: hypothetical protein ACYDCQ_08415 [Dehalococcoidia bacterium]
MTDRRKLALLGIAGGVVTLGAALLAGGVFAQTPGSGSSTNATPTAGQAAKQQQHQAQRDQFLNDLAKNLGVDRGKLDGALKTTETQEIDAAQTSGKLTQAQADKLKAAVANGNVPFGIGGDFGKRGGPDIRQAAMDAVTKALGGETPDQVRADLKAGKTLDQIAQAHNTTVAAVESAVATAVEPLLTQAVAAGTITATQEQQILAGIKNGKGFGEFGGPGHGQGGPGHTRPNRSGSGATAPATVTQ